MVADLDQTDLSIIGPHVKPPNEELFNGEDFLADPELQALGEFVIQRWPEKFDWLQGVNVMYRWKRKGGGSGGKDTLGKCQQISGLDRHLTARPIDPDDPESEVTHDEYLVWFAADHLRARLFNDFQHTALMFHEMRHAWIDRETGKYSTKGHDFEGFADEIEIFGAWHASAQIMAPAFKQVPLFDVRLKGSGDVATLAFSAGLTVGQDESPFAGDKLPDDIVGGDGATEPTDPPTTTEPTTTEPIPITRGRRPRGETTPAATE